MKSKNLIFSISLAIILVSFPNISYSAEKINLYINIFSRSITLKELEDFSDYGVSEGFLKKILKKQNQSLIKEHLTKEYKAPIELTSRLLYSEIGSVVLKKISKIIYPDRIPKESISVLALKTATIKAIAEKNDSISILTFLKAYPSKVIAINVMELSRVINKVESMNELVKFFSDSPLEKLKN